MGTFKSRSFSNSGNKVASFEMGTCSWARVGITRPDRIYSSTKRHINFIWMNAALLLRSGAVQAHRRSHWHPIYFGHLLSYWSCPASDVRWRKNWTADIRRVAAHLNSGTCNFNSETSVPQTIARRRPTLMSNSGAYCFVLPWHRENY